MIKYIGKKHLNSNLYKKVSLTKDGEDVKVKVVVDDKFKNILTIKTDAKVITEQIECLSDFEKVKEMVLYFLRNNKICSLEQCSDKIVVTSLSRRKLILQLDNTYKELLTIIIDKYQSDRLDFININSEKNIYIATANKESYLIFDDIIKLGLMECNNKVASFEIKFLNEYIKNLIYDCSTYIKTYDDSIRYNIYIGDRKISLNKFSIPQQLLKDIYVLILNRNYEIGEMNNKQYKLEGIK